MSRDSVTVTKGFQTSLGQSHSQHSAAYQCAASVGHDDSMAHPDLIRSVIVFVWQGEKHDLDGSQKEQIHIALHCRPKSAYVPFSAGERS